MVSVAGKTSEGATIPITCAEEDAHVARSKNGGRRDDQIENSVSIEIRAFDREGSAERQGIGRIRRRRNVGRFSDGKTPAERKNSTSPPVGTGAGEETNPGEPVIGNGEVEDSIVIEISGRRRSGGSGRIVARQRERTVSLSSRTIPQKDEEPTRPRYGQVEHTILIEIRSL